LSTSSDPAARHGVSVRDVVKRFAGTGRAEPVVALDHITLDVEPGCVVAIVGSNGAGKSTLLSVIAGNVLADEGQVVVGGQDLTSRPSWRRARQVARVRQDPTQNVFGALSIEENFALRNAGSRGRFGLRLATTRDLRRRAQVALEPFGMGLENRMHTLASTLSGGQRQAVAVAMATFAQPGVLLLDEHVAALDPKSARLVTEQTTHAVRSAGITTLIVTHDMASALANSDRLLMFHRGRMVFDLQGAEKERLDVQGLIDRFEDLAGESLSDRSLLAAAQEA
jgi:putative ABC transport system ATP-binding protein